MAYYVITTSEDGDVSIQVMDKAKLLKGLTPREDEPADIRAEEIHTEVEPYTDLTAIAGTYIIKGELVVPKPKSVVTTFEVD